MQGSARRQAAARELLKQRPVELVPMLYGPHGASPGECTTPGAGLVRHPAEFATDADGQLWVGGRWTVTDVDEMPRHVYAIGVVVEPGGQVVYSLKIDDGGSHLTVTGDQLTVANPFPPPEDSEHTRVDDEQLAALDG